MARSTSTSAARRICLVSSPSAVSRCSRWSIRLAPIAPTLWRKRLQSRRTSRWKRIRPSAAPHLPGVAWQLPRHWARRIPCRQARAGLHAWRFNHRARDERFAWRVAPERVASQGAARDVRAPPVGAGTRKRDPFEHPLGAHRLIPERRRIAALAASPHSPHFACPRGCAGFAANDANRILQAPPQSQDTQGPKPCVSPFCGPHTRLRCTPVLRAQPKRCALEAAASGRFRPAFDFPS